MKLEFGSQDKSQCEKKTRLIQSNNHPLHVAQLSGHKNLKSLDVASEQQQQIMSKIISCSEPLVDVTNTAVTSSSSMAIQDAAIYQSSSLTGSYSGINIQ